MSAAASLAAAVLDALREDSAARDELRDLLGVAPRPAATDQPRWLNSDQAAEHLSCTRDRIHDLVQLRKIEARRDGRRLRFRREDLDAYLESSG